MDPNKEGDQGGNGKLPSVDESVVENANVTRSILESQAQEINKLMAIVGGHTTILEMLCASHAERKKTRSFDDEEKTLDPQVHHVGKKQQKKQGSSTKANWNVHALLHVDKVTKGKTSGIKNVGRRRSSRLEQPLKRKLDYDSGEGSHKPFVEGPGAAEDGSPFSTRLAHWKYMDSGELPEFFQVVFRPPQGNRFGATEMAVAAYIFAVDLDQREILFPDEHCQGDRCALWTLRPQHELVDDILNLLVKMLTVERGDESAWWLPTTFAQLALNPTTYCKDTLEFIRTRYMIKKADKIKKIYIPLNKDRHWFLMIVDLDSGDLIYLDSAKDPDDRAHRVQMMTYVAFFLETMLTDKRFYENQASIPPLVSRFNLREPLVTQQKDKSKDCGVFVAQWMQLSHLWGTYDIQGVTDLTRMSLALDIFFSKANKKKDEVVKLAIDYWDKHDQKSSTTRTKSAKKSVAEVVSLATSSSQSMTI